MATYFLINKQVLRFLEVKHVVKGSFGVRTNENAAKIDLVPVTDSSTSKSFVNKILHDNQSASGIPMKQNFEIGIMLPDTLFTDDGANERTGIMKMVGYDENHILSKICCMTDGKISINSTVSNFEEIRDPVTTENEGSIHTSFSWKTEGIELDRSKRYSVKETGIPEFYYKYSSLWEIQSVPVSILNSWKNRKPFHGTFSVFLVISESPMSYQVRIQRQQIMKYKKMLNNRIETDVELISKEKINIKCHRAMLAVSSVKLARKLQQNKGCKEVDFMKHLSLECINALLAYMYYRDLSKATISEGIAVEVLGAAAKFQLQDLVTYVQKYLIKQQSKSFTVDEGVKLYEVAKSSPNDDSLEIKDLYDEMSRDSSESQEEDDKESRESTIETTTDDSRSESEEVKPSKSRRGVKRTNTNENGQGKKFCTRNEVPLCQSEENLTVITQNSEINGNGENESGDEGGFDANDNDLAEDWVKDDSHDRKLLENLAIDIIVGHLRVNSNALEESDEYSRLEESPNLLMGISKMIYKKMSEIIIGAGEPAD